MVVLQYLFWISLAIVCYSYLGYGILLWVLVGLKKAFRSAQKQPSEPFEPAVALIIAAYNEEDFIAEKIINTLALDYPADKLNILFVTDGSTDRTPDIVAANQRLRLMHEPERRGKAFAVNRVVRTVKEPILIFCDANTLLNEACIRQIVKHYADPKVGGVAGEKKIMQFTAGKAASAGEGLYWKYESFLKKLDAELYSVVGAAGELFSVRSHLYEPIREDAIIEDFVLSLQVCMKGYVFRYEPQAFATETGSASMKEEQKRKIRIAAGGFQAMQMLRGLFNIFRYGWLSFQYISHRVLRWSVCPLCLLLLFIVNAALVLQGAGWFYVFFLTAQVLFYLLAATGWIYANRDIKIKSLYVPYYFVFMNAAVFLGFARFVRGKQTVIWEKADRQKI